MYTINRKNERAPRCAAYRVSLMYSVCYYNDDFCDDVVVFSGTLQACKDYIAADDSDPDFAEPLFIVEPDGFTVYGADE